MIGSVTIALIQLCIAQWTKKATAGFACVVFIYFVNLVLPEMRIGIGQHIVVMKTNVLSPDSLGMPLSLFYTINILTMAIFIYVN
ncbi:hypothetical protein, partial [Paenibacillus popilliae]|uniref:hypothetical protein n=1 Tax=Paenibacillus popilliae TaxID=78057 RepID=UPI001F1B6936